MALLDRAIVHLLPTVPRPVVRRISSRYIAGTELEDATYTSAGLNARGKMATIDVLGEETADPRETDTIASAYEEVLARSTAGTSTRTSASSRRRSGSCSTSTCASVTCSSSSTAHACGTTSSASTWRTRRRPMRRSRCTASFAPGAITLSASCSRRREAHDHRHRRARRPEAERPPVQGHLRRVARDPVPRFPCRAAELVNALEALLDSGCYVGIATHDEWLIQQAKRIVEERGLERDRYEFQMLLGVRRGSATHSSTRGIVCGSTCRSDRTGTSIRCAACRRIRASPATSRRTPSAASCAPDGTARCEAPRTRARLRLPRARRLRRVQGERPARPAAVPPELEPEPRLRRQRSASGGAGASARAGASRAGAVPEPCGRHDDGGGERERDEQPQKHLHKTTLRPWNDDSVRAAADLQAAHRLPLRRRRGARLRAGPAARAATGAAVSRTYVLRLRAGPAAYHVQLRHQKMSRRTTRIPTIIRITPTAVTSRPLTSASTAQVRMAPNAARRRPLRHPSRGRFPALPV